MFEGERLYFNSVDHGVLKPAHLISNVPANPGALRTKNKLIHLAAINTKNITCHTLHCSGNTSRFNFYFDLEIYEQKLSPLRHNLCLQAKCALPRMSTVSM